MIKHVNNAVEIAIIAVIMLVIGYVILGLCYSLSNDDAMIACQKTHSFEVCQHTLNR